MGGCWLSRFLASRRILLGTEVGREIEWLILTELLELPIRQGYRIARKDALAETILASPYIQSVLTKTSKALAAALVPARNHTPQRPGLPDIVPDFLRPGGAPGAATASR